MKIFAILFFGLIIISGSGCSKESNFILNIAVGGNWSGYPDETTEFPQTMEVDYIRVYERIIS